MKERVYCIVRCDEFGTSLGRVGVQANWLLLNRKYKPAGTGITDWVNYSDCPGTRVWLDETLVRAIDGGRTPYKTGDRMCWLYHEGNRSRRADYRRRLAMLMERCG